jgi:putative transposase
MSHKHNRKSIRLRGYDYAGEGAYFITIVCKDRVHWFGEVRDDVMHLSDAGRIAQEEWLRTAELREQVSLDAFVIMPNHIHGILLIGDPLPSLAGIGMYAQTGLPRNAPTSPTITGPRPDTLGTIIRMYKQACTIRIRKEHPEFVWLRDFHDHIIRNQESYDRIRQYIINNPKNWKDDGYF